MGTYSSRAAAKKRLRDIEYFKHQNSAKDGHLFPRSGEGDVPPFFRKNLDYGERQEVLKKRLSKLKSVKTALQGLGLKKEASGVRNSIRSLLLSAFLGIGSVVGGISILNESLTDGYLKDLMADFALEESPNLEEKKMEFPLGATTDTIIQSIYPDIPTEDKKDIIIEFLKEYNPNLSFEDGVLALKEKDIIKHTHRAEVAYPDLSKVMQKFIQRLSSGYNPSEVGRAGSMSLSPEGAELMMKFEGFAPKIYNDNSDLSWPKDRDNPAGKGHWMIGYGHQLQPEELSSGIISLSSEDKIRWTDGITEDEAKRIKRKDLLRISILKAGVDPEEELTRGMFDSLTDLSYNVGPGKLSRILEKSKDSSGKISEDLFSRELGTWTGVVDPKKKKGIKIRRISQILMAKGVLLPEDPKNIENLEQRYDVVMSTPNKEVVHKYLTYFGDKNKLSEDRISRVLKQISTTKISSPEDFAKILKTSL